MCRTILHASLLKNVKYASYCTTRIDKNTYEAFFLDTHRSTDPCGYILSFIIMVAVNISRTRVEERVWLRKYTPITEVYATCSEGLSRNSLFS